MAVNQVYRNFLSQLQVLYGPGEASVITDRVFEKIASIKRSDIIRDPERQLNDSTSKLLNDALADLLEHKPVQYVLGEAWFYQLNLKVNDQVLIPRPETEELVKLLIDNSLSFKTDPVVLDMGTGSGCIAIALKKNLPATKITGLDISSSALDLARENASFHQTNIEFILMDFLDDFIFGPLNYFDRLEGLLRGILYRDLGYQFAVLYPDRGGKHSRREVEILLKHYGIAVYGRTHDAKHMYFRVKKRQVGRGDGDDQPEEDKRQADDRGW